MLRYLFGFNGDPLVEDALAIDAQRALPADIEDFLAAYMPAAAPGATGSSPLGATLGTSATASHSTTETPTDAEQVDAVWGKSSQNAQTDDWPAADRARRASIYRALAYDALQSRTKARKDKKPGTDTVDLLMLQR
jgi:hypothetical protein